MKVVFNLKSCPRNHPVFKPSCQKVALESKKGEINCSCIEKSVCESEQSTKSIPYQKSFLWIKKYAP